MTASEAQKITEETIKAKTEKANEESQARIDSGVYQFIDDQIETHSKSGKFEFEIPSYIISRNITQWKYLSTDFKFLGYSLQKTKMQTIIISWKNDENLS